MASELSMNGRKKVETLQKEFTQKFAYLTLVFLDKERRAIDISKSLSEVRQAKGDDISIIASLKVNTLEKRFLENFGLIVEVAYQKSDKVVYTKDNVDKTLNELNKWCEENGCQPFEFKKSFTGNTLSSVQEQLFESIKAYYPNAEAKKINKDNYLDVYVPEINKKRGTHLYFNTAKDGIKIGFYCRDEEFIEVVLSKSTNIEKYAQGIRILDNPLQNNVEEATASALSFIEEITGEKIGLEEDENIADNEDQINIDEFINKFVEKQGADSLNDLLSYYQQEGKIVITKIAAFQLIKSIKEDIDLINCISIVGSVTKGKGMWSELSKLIGEVESDWVKDEYNDDNPDSIVVLYSENKYVYSFSIEGEEAENITKSEEDRSIEDIMRDLGYDDEEETEVSEQIDEDQENDEFSLSSFDVKEKSVIDKISDEIKRGKYLTNLLYVNNKLDELGYAIDKHQAYFFDSNVLVSDRELEGFLVVNMDGFYSNCMDEEEMNPIFSWSGVNDIDYSETKNGCSIDIISDEGTLTIKKAGSHSLKILYTFYENVWKEINENFKDEPFIEWGEVRDMGINEVGFSTFLNYCNFKVSDGAENSESEEDDNNLEIDEEETIRLPKNALDLIACVYILKYYYLGLNEGKNCSDNFDDEFTNLFKIENFSNDKNSIIKEIKWNIENGTINELILFGIKKADKLYENNYETHDDFVSDIHSYFCNFDLLDDALFQTKFLSANIEIGNQLSDISNTGKEIKPQDRYLLVHIALSNWNNLKNKAFDFDMIFSNVKYNLPAGSLLKYAIRDEDLTLMEKAALFVYNVILLDDDGLEIKNKDIYRAKQLIGDFFGFEIKIEGLNVASMLKGSLNNSGKDDLGALIGGFENNFCFDVMHFFNCNFSISKFRVRCIDLFKNSYQEINDTYGGYIEDAIEDTQFDAEDEREEKIMSQYNAAINTDEEEE
jgi:hypothetical protein